MKTRVQQLIRRFLIFLLVSMTLSFAKAQPLDSLWMYYYDVNFENVFDIVQKYDSEYLVIGRDWEGGTSNPRVACISKNGVLLWYQNYISSNYDEFRSVIATSDSNYLIGGSFNRIAWLVKMNDDGDTLWTKTYSDSLGIITCIQELPNNDLIISGNSANYSEDFYLMKTNQYGDTIWTHKYIFGETYPTVSSKCVRQTTDGGFLVSAGYWSMYFEPYSIFMKTDSIGDTLWTKNTMFELDVKKAIFPDILIDQDTIYLIGSGTLFYDWGVIVIKMKPNGEEYWLIKEYNGWPYCSGTFTNKGTLMLAADLHSSAQNKVSVIEIDKKGNIVWEKIYGEIDGYYSTRLILKTFNNDYVISGMNHYDVFLLKIGEKTSGINPEKEQIDISLRVFPNPVKSTASIGFTLNEKRNVDISIYNLKGEKVALIAKKQFPQGNHKLQWDGSTFPRGIYFCKLETEYQVQVRKIIMSR